MINAAPLYWRPTGATTGLVIVASENDIVYALNETTGLPVWQTQLGTAATPTSGCGNIDPIGVTGTPVIDAATGTLYLDATTGGTAGPTHQLFALSLTTGADGGTGALLYSSPAVASTIHHFSTLLVANGRLFVTSDNKVVAYTLGGAN